MRFPNYSLKNIDEILDKSIAFHKMKPSDPKFDKCIFELHNLMCAKGDVGTISNVIMKTIRIHKLAHCHDYRSKESLDLGDDHMHDDDIEQGYYD